MRGELMLDKKFLYQGILKSLKTGTVPDKGYLELLVGREAELEAFKEEIIYVSKGGGSTRFIRGIMVPVRLSWPKRSGNLPGRKISLSPGSSWAGSAI